MTIAVYRLSKERYRDQVFSGLGGLYADGRWTQQGRPVVYTSQAISLAVLEYALNYKRHGWLPSSVIARADIPDGVPIEAVSPSELPDDWRDPDPPEALRRIGQDWLQRAETLCLKVPSAIIPEEANYLLNPLHPDFGKLIFTLPEVFYFDRRLTRERRRRNLRRSRSHPRAPAIQRSRGFCARRPGVQVHAVSNSLKSIIREKNRQSITSR